MGAKLQSEYLVDYWNEFFAKYSGIIFVDNAFKASLRLVFEWISPAKWATTFFAFVFWSELKYILGTETNSTRAMGINDRLHLLNSQTERIRFMSLSNGLNNRANVCHPKETRSRIY